MNPNTIFIIIVLIIVFEFIFNKVLDYLNAKSWDSPRPKEVADLFDEQEYEKAKRYAQTKGKVALISGTVSLAVALAMLFFNGFALVDGWAKAITQNQILQALVFFAILVLATMLINLPFGIYNTFVVEEKFGFNKTTPKTFILDFFKGIILSAIVGGILLGALSWAYYKMGNNFWWIAWIIVSTFSLFFATFYTTLIVPIFNKLTPLEDGSLRENIENYAKKVHFPLKNIFVIDGSKRSSKANAFFSGMGKTKAIVLYDTLIANNTDEELTAVLAHEVGHYKMNHIKKSMAISIIQIAVLFFLFAWLSKSDALVAALGVSENSFHISFIAFSLLYAPISMILGIFMNLLSRKNEFEADNFAKTTYSGQALISSLKKLSKKHLSNLTPHPWYVFIHYSHPPLYERIRNILKK
ncbi:MAG: M48 family metallopeptidase [Chitinophagales bacterium]|nr:M48 family metallopeptidase [Chitinophagales bacterium]